MKQHSLWGAILLAGVLSACSSKMGSNGGTVNSQSLGELDQLIGTGQNNFLVKLDKVQVAELLPFMCGGPVGCPGYASGAGAAVKNTPPPTSPVGGTIALSTVYILGEGSLAVPSNSGFPEVDNLNLTVAFNISDGSCFAAAQSALANGDGLEIAGDATILPFPYNIGVATGGGAVQAGNSTAIPPQSAVNAGNQLFNGTYQEPGTPTPVFYAPEVGVVFGSISNCQEVPNNNSNDSVTVTVDPVTALNAYGLGACPMPVDPPVCNCGPQPCSCGVAECNSGIEVLLQGPGTIDQSNGTTESNGQLSVGFSVSMSDSCYQLAQTAYATNSQLSITGKATVSQLTVAVDPPAAGATVPAPATPGFVSYPASFQQYSVQFSEIDSCTATATEPPTPVPVPLPLPANPPTQPVAPL